MVNTEHKLIEERKEKNYNILNIVVNTELLSSYCDETSYYNILNIVVNTEPT